jgi:hypothetical protein
VALALAPPSQETPFTAKSVGASFDTPDQVPWKPKLIVPPEATEPLYASLVADTLCPVCVTCAFHAEVTCWPASKVQVTSQDVSAAPPSTTLTSAVNPPVHWLTWYVTEHPTAAAALPLRAGAMTLAAATRPARATAANRYRD